MKIILFGASGYGNAVMQRLLHDGHEVPLVFTAAEEGMRPEHSLTHFARSNGSVVFEDIDALKDGAAFEAATAVKADVVLVVNGYDRKLSMHVAKLAPEALYVHPSLLPKFRGPAPSNWAIIEGDETTGVTLSKLARQNDAGDVLATRTMTIDAKENDAQLRARLSTEMCALLSAYLAESRSGKIYLPRTQDDTKATMYPALSKRDGHIRFDQGSERILARVRGVTPTPGAYTDFCGVEFPIAEIVSEGPEAYNDEPGHVLALDDDKKQILVKTMDGQVRVTVIDELNRLGAIAHKNRDLMLFAGKITPFSSSAITGEAAYDTGMPDAEEFTKYLEFPDMIVIAVAYPCNAHCPNCPYVPENSEIREKYGDAQFMSAELFKKIADECGEAARNKWLPGGVGGFIRITGGGEPMLHPAGMTNLIEYAMKAQARVYLNTNGSLFKGDDIDRLLACNVDNIEVSVDAADADTYNIVRKGLDWEHLLTTMRYMVRRRNELRSQTTIEVSVINQEIVSGSIEQIEKFWYELGVDNVIIRKFLTWGSSTNIDPNTSADPLAYLDRDSGVPCPYPFHRLNVDSRGKVEVCGFDIMGRTNFGNLNEQTLREVWRGHMFSWWRQKHQDGRGGDIPLCAECPDWKYRSWEHNYRKALKNAQIRRDTAFANA